MGWGLNTPDFAKLLQPVPVVFLTFHTRPDFTTNDAFADVSAAKAVLIPDMTEHADLPPPRGLCSLRG
jgi:hypothetical protein